MMASTSSLEQLTRQLETLQRELEEYRQAKEKSRDNEFKYRSVVENANEAILVAQNGFFQYANPKAEELFGFPLASCLLNRCRHLYARKTAVW